MNPASCRLSELKGTWSRTSSHRWRNSLREWGASPGHISGWAEPGLTPLLDFLSSALLGPLHSVSDQDKLQYSPFQNLLPSGMTQITSGLERVRRVLPTPPRFHRVLPIPPFYKVLPISPFHGVLSIASFHGVLPTPPFHKAFSSFYKVHWPKEHWSYV